MAAPKKQALRFESFPPEVRNMIYKHLFPPAESCIAVKIRRFLPHWHPHFQYTYIFHTAILRSNRLIGQEATSVLYGSNILVLITFDIPNCSAGNLILKIMSHVAFNQIPEGAPLPPGVVQIDHQAQPSGRARASMIVAAADVSLVCTAIPDQCYGQGYRPSALYFLVALPQLGWPYKMLLETIWLPLKALREDGCLEIEGPDHGSFKVIDHTGVFEQTDEKSDCEEESEQKSNTGAELDSDTEENENDGRGSEGNERDERDSNNDEVEEDDSEDIGRASTRSVEVDSGENDGDENEKAEDRSDEAIGNKHCREDGPWRSFQVRSRRRCEYRVFCQSQKCGWRAL